jgi:hypothetical protein
MPDRDVQHDSPPRGFLVDSKVYALKLRKNHITDFSLFHMSFVLKRLQGFGTGQITSTRTRFRSANRGISCLGCSRPGGSR